MMTRRNFVGALAITSAVGGLGLGGMLVARRRIDAAQIDVATARSLERRDVRLNGEGRAVRARVEDVHTQLRRGKHGAPHTEQISICVAVDDPRAPAGLYRLEDGELSLGELYFSRVNGNGSDHRLEAVISRIV